MPDSPFVDSHVHIWDFSNGWYSDRLHRFAVSGDDNGVACDYSLDDYLNGAGSVEVSKIVHVSLVSDPRDAAAETRWLTEVNLERGYPHAVIATVDPAQSIADIGQDLADQARSPLFRGIRVLRIDLDSPKTAELVRLLQSTGWIYEFAIHPDEFEQAARLAEQFGDVQFVLEHAGWPTGGDDESLSAWRAGLGVFGERHNVACKISGLAMPLQDIAVPVLKPWVEQCLEVFGVPRCFFGSNFPVDRPYGELPRLIGAYREICSNLPDHSIDALFSANAEQLYGL